jgi:hypothetical protein
MTHCLRYESGAVRAVRCSPPRLRVHAHSPSMVGSYSSTKWLWISWMVRQDFPTPPPPTTTSLYSRRNCARVSRGACRAGGRSHLGGHCGRVCEGSGRGARSCEELRGAATTGGCRVNWGGGKATGWAVCGGQGRLGQGATRRRDGAGSAGGRDGAAGGRAGWCEGRSVELSAGNRNGNGSRSLFGCRAKTTVACLVG